MRTRLRAHTADRWNEYFSRIYVPQISLGLELDAVLDDQRLARALRLSLDEDPVLGSVWRRGWHRPHWDRLTHQELDAAPLLTHASGPDHWDRFLCSVPDPAAGPQVSALVEPTGTGCRLALRINHQVSDAAGLRDYAQRLARTYRRLGDSAAYRPAERRGSRSLRQIYRGRELQELRAFWARNREIQRSFGEPGRCVSLGAHHEQEGPYVYRLHRVGPDTVSASTQAARQRGGTLNDALVTAALRALDRGFGQGDSTLDRRLIGTADLRRYLPHGDPGAICNLSGFYSVNLGHHVGDSWEETFDRVKADIDHHKANGIGLGNVFGVHLAMWWIPDALTRSLARQVAHRLVLAGNTTPSLTNMGRLRPERLSFGHVRPTNAWLLVPPSVPPFAGLGVSGFEGTLTLSAGIWPDSLPPSRVERFFALIESELTP